MPLNTTTHLLSSTPIVLSEHPADLLTHTIFLQIPLFKVFFSISILTFCEKSSTPAIALNIELVIFVCTHGMHGLDNCSHKSIDIKPNGLKKADKFITIIITSAPEISLFSAIIDSSFITFTPCCILFWVVLGETKSTIKPSETNFEATPKVATDELTPSKG